MLEVALERHYVLGPLALEQQPAVAIAGVAQGQRQDLAQVVHRRHLDLVGKSLTADMKGETPVFRRIEHGDQDMVSHLAEGDDINVLAPALPAQQAIEAAQQESC